MVQIKNSAKIYTFIYIFIFAVALLHLFIGYQIGGRLGLFAGFIFSVGMIALMFFFGESSLSRKITGPCLQGQDSWGLLKYCQLYSKQLMIKMPQIQIIDSPLPICFAVTNPLNFIFSQNESENQICISSSVLNRLSTDEVKALLANLCCKLKENNKFIFLITNLIANSLLGLTEIFDKFIFTYKPFSTLATPLSWLLIRIGIGHHTIFETDKMSISLFQNSKALANVILKLESLSVTQPIIQIPPCSEHLFLINPSPSPLFKNPFLPVHPQVSRRVKNLIGYFPI